MDIPFETYITLLFIRVNTYKNRDHLIFQWSNHSKVFAMAIARARQELVIADHYLFDKVLAVRGLGNNAAL